MTWASSASREYSAPGPTSPALPPSSSSTSAADCPRSAPRRPRTADPMRANDDLAALLQRLRTGDRRALSRALTLIENGHPQAGRALAAGDRPADAARRVGITGPPGAGKSTLVAAMAGAHRAAGRSVAVLAVDPSSPDGRGAILGDRTRMSRHYLDPGVFIRSMGTRGALGGLSDAAGEALVPLHAA